MPAPLVTRHREPFGGYRHTLWVPLSEGADLVAAVGPLDPDTASLIGFEDISAGGVLLTVSVFTEEDRLAGDDPAAPYGENAESWCRATLTGVSEGG